MRNIKHDEEPKTQFTGWWIPAEIVGSFQNGTIKMEEMVLLATIDSLIVRNEDGVATVGCWAGNDWLAKKMGYTNPNMITKLKQKEFLFQVPYYGKRTSKCKRYLETKWTRVRKPKDK